METGNQATIRPAITADRDAIWEFLEPVIRAGETYCLDRDMPKEQALDFWFSPHHQVFAACSGDEILGTYFLKANQQGGGRHVANCGYVTAPAAQGRGIARAMLEHSLDFTRDQGFRAMQYNFVIASNHRAVKLWQAYDFHIIGTLPGAFNHPNEGYVDAHIMYRVL